MSHAIIRVCLLIIICSLANACSTSNESAQPTNNNESASVPMVVYKSPTCGCCQAWVSYVEDAGFSVTTIDTDDVDAIKSEYGLIDPSLKSCHTAVVDGYVVEGHVPVSDIERLLSERPAIVGLTAPGMPAMSPGMGSETPKEYDVLAFDKNGSSRIYSSY